MKILYNVMLSKLIILILTTLSFASSDTYAQLSGNYYIDNTHLTGGQYFANFTDAINALNIGVTGPVTFNVTHDQIFNENLPPITATGTALSPIIFQKSGSGNNPEIVSGAGSGINDGIIVIAGGSYFTFDAVDLMDNPANVTQAAQMEWGFALLKANSTAPFVGCQHIIIKNCNISLNRSNIYSVGIYSGTHTYSAPNTALTIVSPSDAMNNCNFYNNNISNVFSGIKLRGDSLAAFPYNLFDQNNGIGITETGSAGPNHITKFGSVQQSSSWLIYGIYVSYQNNVKIDNNVVLNDSVTGNNGSFANIFGIYTDNALTSNGEISGNTITMVNDNPNASTSNMAGISSLMGGSGINNTVNISNNTVRNCSYSSATITGTFAGVQNSASVGNLIMTGNTVINNTFAGAGNWNGIDAGGNYATPVNINFSFNTVTNNSKLSTGNMYSTRIYASTGLINFSSNIIAFNSMHNQSGTSSTSNLYGFYSYSMAINEDDNNNQMHDLTISSNIVNGSGFVYGMYLGGGNPFGNRNITGNQIYALLINNNNGGTYSGSAYIYGMDLSAVYNTLYLSKNNIYNLTAYGNSPVLLGIDAEGGYNLYLYNNFISDLNDPIASSTSLLLICGLYLSNTNSFSFTGAYFNTVYLNSTSTGTDFGTTAVYATASHGMIELKNNLFINNSVQNGAGINYAFRRNAVSTAEYSLNSDANDFYCGTPGTNNLIYFDGTNSVQTISDLKNYLSSDSHSFTELPHFVNTASKPYDLHIKTNVATTLESGGIPVNSPVNISDDYYGNSRNNSTPDVGANEFTGIIKDQISPVISFTPLGNTASLSNRTLTVTINDASGVPISGIGLPRLYWKSSGSVYNAVTAVSLGDNQYQFTFGSGVSVGQTVDYYIVAQDNAATPNVGSLPSIGAGGFGINPPSAATPPSPFLYTVLNGLSGTYHIGPGEVSPNFTKLTAAVNALNNGVISGPVTFILDSTFTSIGENFPIIFQKNAGSSSTNTVTLKPAASGVAITGFTGSPASNTILVLINGMSYFTLDGSSNGTTSRDLTLNNNCPNGGSFVFYVASLGPGNGATHVILKNCNINAFVKGSDQAVKVSSQNPANTDIGENNDFCTIQNNVIKRCSYGIFVGGSPWGKDNGLSILNNMIGDSVYTVSYRGIYLRGCIAPLISGNQISNMIDSSSVGSAVAGVAGIEIFEPLTDGIISNNIINNIISLAHGSQPVMGMLIGGSLAGNISGLKIFNNFISGLSNGDYGTTTTLQNSPVGIRITNASDIHVYFNSINMNGTQVTGGTNPIPSAAFAIDGGNGTTSSYNIDLRNNILINTLGGRISGAKNYAVWIKSQGGVSMMDYNDYFTPSGSGYNGVLGNWWGSDYTALSGVNGFQNASLGDIHSVVDSVDFVSKSDLHLTGESIGDLKLSGTFIDGITTDIDGDQRFETPYMGADETGSPLPVELVSFTANAQGKDISLNWKTASEKNTYYFNIERTSVKNKVIQDDWKIVGEVKATGNSTVSKQYSYTDKNITAGMYAYRLKIINLDGSFLYSNTVESEIALPVEFILSQNYPNPFNPSTKIDYQLPVDSKVSIEIFNITGQKVGELVNKEQSAGFYSVELSTGTIHKTLASGVYIYRMTAINKINGNNFINVKKMIMLK